MTRIKDFITLSKKHIALGLAVTLTLGVLLPVTTVNAQESHSDDFVINELSHEDSLDAREQMLEDLENDNFIIHASIESLDIENVNVFEIITGETILTQIRIPIVDKDFNLLSNFTVTYDVALGVVSYSETHVVRSEYETFQIFSFSDGLAFWEDITDIEYITNEEFQEGIYELQRIDEAFNNPMARNVWCVIGQLGLAGIAAATAAAICGVPCKLKPTACATCFTATMGFFGVSAYNISRCFN